MLISKLILARSFAIVASQTSFCQVVGVGHFTSDSATLVVTTALCGRLTWLNKQIVALRHPRPLFVNSYGKGVAFRPLSRVGVVCSRVAEWEENVGPRLPASEIFRLPLPTPKHSANEVWLSTIV